MTQTARIYGDSLYDLAKEDHLTDRIFAHMQDVRQIFIENPVYRRLLAEPSVSMTERIGLLDEAFGGKIEAYLLNFIKILCERGLLMEYEGCCQEYQERYYKDCNIAAASVTSAVALTLEQTAALKTRLEKMCGKKVILTQKVSASVIGGMRIELEGRLIDGTVAGRLDSMQKKLKEVVL